MTCPCAFRPRGLAQNARITSEVRHFSRKFSREWRQMSMCISIAQARTKYAANFWGAHFPINCRAKWLLSGVHVHFDYAGSHKAVVPLLVPSVTIFARVSRCTLALEGSHCLKILQMPCLRRACMKSLVGCSCIKIL